MASLANVLLQLRTTRKILTHLLNPLLNPPQLFLFSRGFGKKSWKTRWFQLTASELTYFEPKSTDYYSGPHGQAKGSIGIHLIHSVVVRNLKSLNLIVYIILISSLLQSYKRHVNACNGMWIHTVQCTCFASVHLDPVCHNAKKDYSFQNHIRKYTVIYYLCRPMNIRH